MSSFFYNPTASSSMSPPVASTHTSPNVEAIEGRGGLTRRFTTNALPSLSPIGQQRLQAVGDNSMQSERKIRHIENLLEQQRRITAELEQVDHDTRREIEEGLRHERAAANFMANSEPTTPPEYQDPYPSVVARPNRYSAASMVSPPTFASRSHRSSIQLASPPMGHARPYSVHTSSGFPSQSVPGSRRHSDDEDDEYLIDYTTLHRAAANPNRNSMPITAYGRKGSATAALGPLNTTSFLFEDESRVDSRAGQVMGNSSSPDSMKTYLQVQHTADGFPKLIRREEASDQSPSGASVALDLTPSPHMTPEQYTTDRPMIRRHRISLPPTTMANNASIAHLDGILATTTDLKGGKDRTQFFAEAKRPSLLASPARSMINGSSKGPISYSTNDIPTLNSFNSINGSHNIPVSAVSPPSRISQPYIPSRVDQGNTTASPARADRSSQDFTATERNDKADFQRASMPGLQANAVPFGPSSDGPVPSFSPSMAPASQNFYGKYGVNMLSAGLNDMTLNGGGFANQPPWASTAPPQTNYNGYQPFQARQPATAALRFPRTSQPTVLNKSTADDGYNSLNVSQLQGQIYGLCKDQHFCRFLQRKLDEHREQDVEMIFDEVKDHCTELMTDPFGNYLIQRLLEHADNDQRTVLIKNAAPFMTSIAVNQHGTRAVQRMIEFITTPEQTLLLIEALRDHVVELIHDLNGNHVIQRCLNHLTAENSDFIFAAVADNCVAVATQKTGCVVLQRCVDHANGPQKARLVNAITVNTLELVQNAYGNYCVQHALDLSEPTFTRPLCMALGGHVVALCKQKFASNVVEKALRCADLDTRRLLIGELLVPQEIEAVARGNYSNYVLQSALNCCPEDLKPQLVDAIRPLLGSLRNTPHGRRLANAVQEYDLPTNAGWAGSNGLKDRAAVGPGPGTMAAPSVPRVPNGAGNRMGMVGPPRQWTATNPRSGPTFEAQHFGAHAFHTQASPSAYGHLNGTVNTGGGAPYGPI